MEMLAHFEDADTSDGGGEKHPFRLHARGVPDGIDVMHHGRSEVKSMMLQGEYVPSARGWVRDQVEAYERSGGREANTLRDTGLPVVIVTMRGNKSGNVRKIALMRVEHDGEYALVASKGGAPKHPVWYYNLKANPDEVTIQDGPEPFPVRARQVTGDERAAWWERAVAAFPPYAEYQQKTERQIPVFVLEPVS
jgi:F420H(2)-dependent quinone reductase